MLPPPIMVSEPGSFAERTIVKRKPQIIAKVIAQNAYPAEIVAALCAFREEIATGIVAPLHERAADVDLWHRAWQPWEGKTWRQLGWFFAETYFYRRLLETTGYFQPGPGQLVDPFEAQKAQILAEGLETFGRLGTSLPECASVEEQFSHWLGHSLWGNRADLSTLTTNAWHSGRMDSDGLNQPLVDHTQDVWTLLTEGKVQRLDLVADNCGPELCSDLGLIDFLLSHHLIETVHVWLKSQPYYVSDAMVKDLAATENALRDAPVPALHALSRRLQGARAAGRFVAHDHPFFATCLFYTQLSPDLRAELARSDLIIIKGDANYRRLVEDRHWPPTTDLAAITSYMPASFLALRTIKAELILGLPQGRAEALAREDPAWRTSGDHGVIHMVPR